MRLERTKSMKVYLADLRHNYQGYLTSDAMPLGIGYMKAMMDKELTEVDSRLFVYPDELERKLSEAVPDVFLATNYAWNESLNQHFAKKIKELNPESLIIVGGPNIPLEDDRRKAYLKERSFIDVYVTGEGDFLAMELVRSYMDVGMSVERLLMMTWHSVVYRDPLSEQVTSMAIKPRSKNLDEIPSPWLTGVMDQFFDGKLAPLFETNRGCPFTCTFCVQGTKWYTKVNYFGMNRIKEELDYIGLMIAEKCPEQKVLRIADPNFGMYERDVEISEHIGKKQEEYNWPLLIDATTGKNRADRIIRSIEKVNGALMMYQAVQSLDEEVLENVKRQNIKLDTYEEVQIHVRGRGLRSSSDLILGLPGETLISHTESLKKLINSGTHKLNNFQSMMLKGAELETLEMRNKFGFETKFRLVPKNFGAYFGEKVFDFEEIIVATDTLSFEDYLKARTYHLAINLFWNESRFEQLVELLTRVGITKWEWIESLTKAPGKQFPKLKKLKDEFLEETRNELFDSLGDAETFYSQEKNFAKLVSNEIGDNLIYKYRAMGSFLLWPEVCQAVFSQTKLLLSEAGRHVDDDFWKDAENFFVRRFAHGRTPNELLKERSSYLTHDIGRWLKDGLPDNHADYRLSSRQVVKFALSESNYQNIQGALNIWSYNTKSISMLVRRVHHDWRNMEWTFSDQAERVLS